MRRIIICALLLLIQSPLYARLKGQARIDSLLRELPKAKEDTNKAKLLRYLSLAYVDSKPDEGLKYGQQELELATKLSWRMGIASANYDLGINYLQGKGDFPKALEHYTKSLKGFEEIKDKAGIASLLLSMGNICLVKAEFLKAVEYYQRGLKQYEELGDIHGVAAVTCNIGLIYYSQGNYAKALEYLYKALKIDEEHGYKNYIGNVYGNIASIYGKQGNYSKALEYYGKDLKLNEELGNKDGLARCIGNIGTIYKDMGNSSGALEQYLKALKMRQEAGDNAGLTQLISNIGIVYKDQKNYTAAIEYFESSLKLAEKNGQKEMVTTGLFNIGDLYLAIIGDTSSKKSAGKSEVNNASELLTGSYKPDVALPVGRAALLRGAFDYLQRGLVVAKEINVPDDMLNCYKGLAKAYELSGDYKKSLEMSANWHAIQDSVYSKENREKIAREEEARQQYGDSLKAADAQKAADVKAAHRRNYELIGGAAFLLLLGFTFLLKKNNKLLDKEKKQSETLLHNILPEEVAAQLKDTGKSAAKQFDDVTVLFTDFVNFTEASERMKPDALIEELDTCFKAFDDITGKYNIEKIKTIGDAYLAVCGLPTADPKHAENVVNAAKEINAFMADRLSKMGSERTFAVRIGIHSGSVVAGIVGVKKFAYDIWGDTVNTAARMEQNSEAGKINISETTYELVKDKFPCQYRGEVEAKGKGVMKMYFVS